MKILVIDDQPSVRDYLRHCLSFNGHEILLTDDGDKGLEAVRRQSPDLAILDAELPTIDGMEVCRALRSSGHTLPLLMLSNRNDVADRVAGLNAGADDYLVKPFAMEELIARVHALLRRAALATPTQGAQSPHLLTFEDLSLDPQIRQMRRGDRVAELTHTETSLLTLFLTQPRHVLSRSTLITQVWGADASTSNNSLDVYIGYLRRKTEAGGEPRLIHTLRGVGYVLREPSA